MDKANKIKRILSKVRPDIKSHGGDVELVEIKGKTVTLEVGGACAGCPLAELTYNKVVRDLIKEEVPEVERVVLKTAQNKSVDKLNVANQKEYPREKDGSNIGKIVIDRDLCIGAASCVAVSPATFELDSENKVIVIDTDAVDDETLKQAAQSCPTKAILLFDKEGKQIYP